MTWLHSEINRGLTSLAVYNWEGTPSREQDAMDLMVNGWVSSLMFNRVWEYDRDTPRIRDAFMVLTSKCRRWPSVSEFLEVLPAPEQKALPQKPIPANPAHVQKILDELGRELRIPPPVSRETEREKIDTAAAEQELRTHYADQKTAAAGGDA